MLRSPEHPRVSHSQQVTSHFHPHCAPSHQPVCATLAAQHCCPSLCHLGFSDGRISSHALALLLCAVGTFRRDVAAVPVPCWCSGASQTAFAQACMAEGSVWCSPPWYPSP